MRARLHLLALSAVGAFTALPAHAGSFYGPAEFLLCGGASIPVGKFGEGWNPGPTAAAGFRAKVAPNIMGGIDVGYSWLGKDTENSSGGDAGVLSLSTETDVYLRREEGGKRYTTRPFLSAGLGYSHVSIGGGSTPTAPTFDDADAFELHGGAGILFELGGIGLRVDVAYRHIFVGSEDMGYVPVRGSLVFGGGRRTRSARP